MKWCLIRHVECYLFHHLTSSQIIGKIVFNVSSRVWDSSRYKWSNSWNVKSNITYSWSLRGAELFIIHFQSHESKWTQREATKRIFRFDWYIFCLHFACFSIWSFQLISEIFFFLLFLVVFCFLFTLHNSLESSRNLTGEIFPCLRCRFEFDDDVGDGEEFELFFVSSLRLSQHSKYDKFLTQVMSEFFKCFHSHFCVLPRKFLSLASDCVDNLIWTWKATKELNVENVEIIYFYD